MIVSDTEGLKDTTQAAAAGLHCMLEEPLEQRSHHSSIEHSNRSTHLLSVNHRDSSGKREQEHSSDAMEEEATITPGDALLCIVDGQEKENISPVKIYIDEQHKIHTAIESPQKKLMDEDKEPVFAEENLDKTQPMFEEASSEPKAPADAKAESPISERNMMIVTSPPAKPLRTPAPQHQQTPLSRQTSQKKIPPSSLSFKPNQPLAKPSTPNLKAASKALDNSFKSRPQTLTPSKSKDILKPKTSNTPRTTEFKSMSPALQKRAPVFEKKENLSKPSTLKTPIASVSLQKDRIKARLYHTVTKPTTDFARTAKPQTPIAATTEKLRIASVTRLHKSPASKQKLHSETDSKLCREIAARQAEAERVLLQKKPPIPKFHFQPRGDSKQKSTESPTELPRKPAVPKLSELMRRRSGL